VRKKTIECASFSLTLSFVVQSGHVMSLSPRSFIRPCLPVLPLPLLPDFDGGDNRADPTLPPSFQCATYHMSFSSFLCESTDCTIMRFLEYRNGEYKRTKRERERGSERESN
jgi:hypothetical protein